MRFNGEWLQCVDGDIRPVIRAALLGQDGVWRGIELLVDTGADRTVLNARALEDSMLLPSTTRLPIGGFGGIAETVSVRSQLRFMRDDGAYVSFAGDYAACTQLEALEMGVLGRDILNMFAIVVDHPHDVVAMIGGQHEYVIQQRR